MADVTVRDLGWKKILAAAKQSARHPDAHVAIGLRGNGKAAAQHQQGALTVAEVGSIHEFGLGKMPQRSFIRATFDKHSKEYEQLIAKVAAQVTIGALPLKRGLSLIGTKGVADIQKFMAAGIAPDKADGETARLIDKGQLRGSIEFEVRNA